MQTKETRNYRYLAGVNFGVPYAYGTVTDTTPDGKAVIKIEKFLSENCNGSFNPAMEKFVGLRLSATVDRKRVHLHLLATSVLGSGTFEQKGILYNAEVSMTHRIPLKMNPVNGDIYEVSKEHGYLDEIPHIPGGYYSVIVQPLYRAMPIAREKADVTNADNFSAKMSTVLFETIMNGIVGTAEFQEWVGKFEDQEEEIQKSPKTFRTGFMDGE